MKVPMELSRIFIREMNDMQIIELTEVDGTRTFPIVIGLPEASAIERRLKGTDVARPQTHDLLASAIRHLGGRLVRIDIHDLSEGTFFANIVVERDGEEIVIDSRPSDAIALGISERVPIFVAERVLEQAAIDSQSANGTGSGLGPGLVDFDDVEDDDEDE
jgi:bifunctional DNase/RNase